MSPGPAPTAAGDATPVTADHAGRRARLAAALGGLGVDALLVTKLSNVRYLTGFSGSSATLLVPVEGHAVLATDGRYAIQAHGKVRGLRKAGGSKEDRDPADVVLVVTRDDGWLPGAVGRAVGRLAVESEHLVLARFLALQAALPDVAVHPVAGVVEELRAVKDAAELAAIRAACRITAESFGAMYGWLAPGQTEREVAHRLLGEMIVRGADGPAFDFIVAAGTAGAEPHHAPTDDALRHGDLVTVDAGARLDGYHADMTRTVALGRPRPELAHIHGVVARAQVAGILACTRGSPGSAVDAASRRVIAAEGYAERFAHPTGHGVGLDIHEPPILHAGQVATLRAGAAVTVEPGIYVPGLGGVRIEDVVAVAPAGREILTDPDARDAHRRTGAPGRDAPDTLSGPGAPATPAAPRASELLVL